MRVTRTRPESVAGPAAWFTGTVWIDQIAAAAAPSTLHALSVHFTPGARTAWHEHPRGQILHVLEGSGRVQSRGGRHRRRRARGVALARCRPGNVHDPPRPPGGG